MYILIKWKIHATSHVADQYGVKTTRKANFSAFSFKFHFSLLILIFRTCRVVFEGGAGELSKILTSKKILFREVDVQVNTCTF